MSALVSALITVVVIGLLVWLVNTFLPLPAKFQKLVNVLGIVIAIVVVIVALMRTVGQA